MHMLIAILLLFTVYSIDGETGRTRRRRHQRAARRRPGRRGRHPRATTSSSPSAAPPSTAPTTSATPCRPARRRATRSSSSSMRDGERAVDPGDASPRTPIADSPLLGKPYVGVVVAADVFETVDHSIAGAAVNSRDRHLPDGVGVVEGCRQGAQPGQHLHPPQRHQRRPRDTADHARRASPVSATTSATRPGSIGILFLLAVLNVFVGVFNMFPLLPLDGGHAAIATYERIRERDGRRYYADVSKMMPFAMAVMTVLLFLFVVGAVPRHHRPRRLTGDAHGSCRLDHRTAQDPPDLRRQGRRRWRRADHGAVDDDHQDGRRRGHAATDLRAGRGRLRHRPLHVQRGRKRPRASPRSCRARRSR